MPFYVAEKNKVKEKINQRRKFKKLEYYSRLRSIVCVIYNIKENNEK